MQDAWLSFVAHLRTFYLYNNSSIFSSLYVISRVIIWRTALKTVAQSRSGTLRLRLSLLQTRGQATGAGPSNRPGPTRELCPFSWSRLARRIQDAWLYLLAPLVRACAGFMLKSEFAAIEFRSRAVGPSADQRGRPGGRSTWSLAVSTPGHSCPTRNCGVKKRPATSPRKRHWGRGLVHPADAPRECDRHLRTYRM